MSMLIPESAGLAEESNEERKAAKKGFFPSSMGLSFLVPRDAHGITVIARWGEYKPTEIEGADGKPVSVWQRQPREETIPVALTKASEPVVCDVPGSGGLQLHVVEQLISAEDLDGHIPHGTRSVSVFLVNHRTPNEEHTDLACPFQAEIEVRGDHPFVRGRTCAACRQPSGPASRRSQPARSIVALPGRSLGWPVMPSRS